MCVPSAVEVLYLILSVVWSTVYSPDQRCSVGILVTIVVGFLSSKCIHSRNEVHLKEGITTIFIHLAPVLRANMMHFQPTQLFVFLLYISASFVCRTLWLLRCLLLRVFWIWSMSELFTRKRILVSPLSYFSDLLLAFLNVVFIFQPNWLWCIFEIKSTLFLWLGKWSLLVFVQL